MKYFKINIENTVLLSCKDKKLFYINLVYRILCYYIAVL